MTYGRMREEARRRGCEEISSWVPHQDHVGMSEALSVILIARTEMTVLSRSPGLKTSVTYAGRDEDSPS